MEKYQHVFRLLDRDDAGLKYTQKALEKERVYETKKEQSKPLAHNKCETWIIYYILHPLPSPTIVSALFLFQLWLFEQIPRQGRRHASAVH